MCPFCYMGKRNLEMALTHYKHTNKVEIIWKSYQFDNAIPEEVNESYSGYLSNKRNISEAEGNERLASITANTR